MPLPRGQSAPPAASSSPPTIEAATAPTTSRPRLYFAYGSNLSTAQMRARCPTSQLYSQAPLAYLPRYRWVISPRGYANVLAVHDRSSRTAEDVAYNVPAGSDGAAGASHKVWGLLYELEPADEQALDVYEGVSSGCYVKVVVDVRGIIHAGSEQKQREEVVKALVYIDPTPGIGKAREEYVHRMNAGLHVAVAQGMDEDWIENAIRPFIPRPA